MYEMTSLFNLFEISVKLHSEKTPVIHSPESCGWEGAGTGVLHTLRAPFWKKMQSTPEAAPAWERQADGILAAP